MSAYYEIIVKGYLGPDSSVWFSGLQLSPLAGGETLLSGEVPDQAALHGILERIRDLNLVLVAVARSEPPYEISLEEIST